MSFHPLRNPEDTVALAGRQVPGLVEIKGLSAPRDWDERRGFGMIGARLRYYGQKLSRFSLVVRLYTEEHWDAWRDFSEIVRRLPPPDRSLVSSAATLPQLMRALYGRARPLRIRHSLLEEYRVRQVVVEDVTQPSVDEAGVWTIEIKLIQYQKPLRVLSTVGGQSDDGDGRNVRLRARVASRTEQLQDLMAEEGNR
jgi:hypothetical protein